MLKIRAHLKWHFLCAPEPTQLSDEVLMLFSLNCLLQFRSTHARNPLIVHYDNCETQCQSLMSSTRAFVIDAFFHIFVADFSLGPTRSWLAKRKVKREKKNQKQRVLDAHTRDNLKVFVPNTRSDLMNMPVSRSSTQFSLTLFAH